MRDYPILTVLCFFLTLIGAMFVVDRVAGAMDDAANLIANNGVR